MTCEITPQKLSSIFTCQNAKMPKMNKILENATCLCFRTVEELESLFLLRFHVSYKCRCFSRSLKLAIYTKIGIIFCLRYFIYFFLVRRVYF